ncbi:MAG: DnaD domain protein [Anaerolineales bacterium]|jgi:DnaD/phage-associated family protein
MSARRGFEGFPEGPTRLTPVPSAFFTELLPAIDHLGEMKVSLYAIWLLARQSGDQRYFERHHLAEDERLMNALEQPGLAADDALDEALERAVMRGTLLRAAGVDGAQIFVLNTAKGRAAMEALERGEWTPDDRLREGLEVDRPTIYSLYEQNIGPLTPMIAESLKDAEASYPMAWIEDAIRLAVENNARKWRYVEAILKDWNTKGRDERKDRGDSQEARRRYVEGEFADYIEH